MRSTADLLVKVAALTIICLVPVVGIPGTARAEDCDDWWEQNDYCNDYDKSGDCVDFDACMLDPYNSCLFWLDEQDPQAIACCDVRQEPEPLACVEDCAANEVRLTCNFFPDEMS